MWFTQARYAGWLTTDVGQKKTTLCEELPVDFVLTFGKQTICAGDFLA